jgi:SOS-response transcriptional repressor LexA
MKPLTDKQQQVYDFINNKKNWRPPTWKQIQTHISAKSPNSVLAHIKSIKTKGYDLPM